MPNSFLDHKSHKKLIGVCLRCLPLLFVEGSTHFGSIISFSHVRVLARILAKAGLDLAGTKRRVGQQRF